MSAENKDSSNKKVDGSDNSIDNNRSVEKQPNDNNNYIEVEKVLEEQEISKKKLHIAWRRGKVLEYLADGQTNQSEIAELLHVAPSVICEDIQILKTEAKERIKSHLEERLPFVFETCLTRLEKSKREAIEIYNKSEAPRIKLQALSLINETAVKILDLMTHNETVLTAMSMTNKLSKQVDILKDKAQDEEVITVVTNSNNDTQRSEGDTGESENTAESDSTTTDSTAEQDSRVF